MKTTKYIAACAIFCWASGLVYAQTYTMGECKGLTMAECGEQKSLRQQAREKQLDQKEAEAMLRYREQEADKKLAQDLRRRQYQEEEAAYQKAKADEQAAKQAEWAAARAKDQAETQARSAEFTRQGEQRERAQAAADRKAAVATASVKEKCGDDYKAPKIGMHLDRIKSCVTPLRLKAQLNRADGVVSTYTGGGAYFHIMNERLVSWGR